MNLSLREMLKNSVWLSLRRTDLLAVSVYGHTLEMHRQKDQIMTTNRPSCLYLTFDQMVNWPRELG